jgi:MFS family permease
VASDRKRQERRRSLEKNLWKIELNALLINFLVYSPILAVSFQEKGLSLAKIGVLMALANIALLFEVPMGVLSDRWSRKRVLALAAMIGACSMLFWSQETFLLLAIGTILRSVMLASVSGSDTALLYDTLKELGREDEYAKYNARRFSTGMAAFAIAAVVASIISTKHAYQWHFLVTALAMLFAAILMFTVVEPKGHLRIDKPLAHLKASFKTATQHPEVFKLVRYTVGIGSTIIIVFVYMQFFMKDAGIDTQWFGLLYAAFGVASFSAGRNAHHVQRWLGKRTLIIVMPIMFATGMLLLILGHGPIPILIGLLLIELVFGVQGGVLNAYLQEHLESTQRSSVESIQSLFGGIQNFVLILLIGIITQATTLQFAFAFLLIVWAVLIIPPMRSISRQAKS